ncbi:CpXC domain-containing protein [Bulleidia sp. zg-1006]|uniref:CpXC domain-containing protein n=1 Tax=Bulleidia sp. zg-1006 TaxID=2806552 RepID=UPI0019398642|nr:CpXC domain-containing protein [Bulleidia sp. zg-1006]QRG86685.1 CpXC domain-containing protein [Bulleidia sp. zg-1006]
MLKQALTYTCPYCHETMDLEVTLSLGAGEEEKELLMSGDLFHHTCDHCQHEFLLQVPFTYMDRMRKFVLVLVQDEVLPKEIEQTGPTLSKAGFKLRHVQTIQQLIEKIQIFEDGVDDCLVELAKYDNFIEFVDNKKGNAEDITSIEYQRVDNEVMKINIRTGDSGMTFLTPLNLIEEEYRIDQDRLVIRNEVFPIVDQKWIISAYQEVDGKA